MAATVPDAGDLYKGLFSDDALLLLATGRAAQLGAQMEMSLRLAVTALANIRSDGIPNVNKGVDQLILLAKASLEREEFESFAEDANAALDSCAEANQRRNRIIHDIWMRESSSVINRRRMDKGRANTLSTEPSDLAYFEQTVIDLARCNIRIAAISSLASSAQFSFPDERSEPEELLRELRQLRGDFVLIGLGGFRFD